MAALRPSPHVSLSSRVAPQIREYPRASTTAINAYAMPIATPYLTGMARGLAAAAIPNKALIMLSSGGIIGAEVAADNPVRMIESGPAAGALAASWYAQRLGLDRLLSFDMGGTTAKACLIEDRKPLVAGAFEVDRIYRFMEGSGMPLTIPSIDMIEIGAGGGSIAGVNDLGLMKVGPRSAGSMPGPACYGQGGVEPTVTDADLVLGLLAPDNFLGGDMRSDEPAARAALARLGERLGVDCRSRPPRASIGSSPRPWPARRGPTPPIAGSTIAALPSWPSAGPARSMPARWGPCLTPPRSSSRPRPACSRRSGPWSPRCGSIWCAGRWARWKGSTGTKSTACCREMSDEGFAALDEAGCARESVTLRFGADLRYFGQQNELTIVFDADPSGPAATSR